MLETVVTCIFLTCSSGRLRARYEMADFGPHVTCTVGLPTTEADMTLNEAHNYYSLEVMCNLTENT